MAKIITDDQHYKDIANAIRESNDETTLYKPSEMADAVRNLSSLNFKIVGGTTQPDDPSENTIWVNTPNEITGWIFSAEEPETPEPGMVWIFTAMSSVVDFNALKENGIQVTPSVGKQYVDGKWVNMPTTIYYGGEWLHGGALYWHGNQNTKLTGGWAMRNTSGSNLSTPQCTFGEDSINLTSESGSKSGILSVSNKIDLTHVKTLHVNIANNTSSYIMLYVGSKINDYEGQVASKNWTAAGGLTLDVSDVTGSYYVGFYIRVDTSVDISISEVYCE